MEKAKIKFGTDGWRAIIAKDFTVENVARVSKGVSEWLHHNFNNPSVVLGHDCRFGGELFAETVATVLTNNGVNVLMADGFVSTPMISFGTLQRKASLGIILTASHNPPSYNGYKLKGHYGGPLLSDGISAIENLIPNDLDASDLNAIEENYVEIIDLETMYCDHVAANFDLEAIRNSNMKFAYDAMYGSGQKAMKRLLPEISFFRCEHNPHFYGISPEPIMKNLLPYADFIKEKGDIDCGIANDGDADRIGLMDGKGNFVDSHHIMLLLIHYLCKYKGWTGKVATGFSSTIKMQAMCDHYGLELQVVPIGFKHICELMVKEDILMGGEESGGIAVKGHIPERDGIWNAMVLAEFMAKSGKSLTDLIEEVYAIVGTFAFERIDLRLSEELKASIVEKCEKRAFETFGTYEVEKLETLDGYKYYLNSYEWVMIRPSGTEPVLRTYAESSDQASAFKILKETHETILN